MNKSILMVIYKNDTTCLYLENVGGSTKIESNIRTKAQVSSTQTAQKASSRYKISHNSVVLCNFVYP